MGTALVVRKGRHAVRRRCATIGTCSFASRSGLPALRSAPIRWRSRATTRRFRSPARRSRAPWPWGPAGRSSPAAWSSGAGAAATPSAPSWPRPAAPGSSPSGTTRVSARPQPSPSASSSSRPARRWPLGDARLPRRPAGLLGGAWVAVALRSRAPCCARSPARTLLRPGDLRLRPVPGQPPARGRQGRGRSTISTASASTSGSTSPSSSW